MPVAQEKGKHIDLSGLEALVNPNFYPLFFDQSRFLVLMGGAGSSKSHSAAQKLIMRGFEGKKRILCLRKKGTTVKDSVWSIITALLDQYGLHDMCRYHMTERRIFLPNGSEFFCCGLDDPERVKSFHGVTDIWVEEATEFTREDIDQLNLRMRGETASYRQMILTFNPISTLHWLKMRFFDPQPTVTWGPNNRYESIVQDIVLDDNEVVKETATRFVSTYHDNLYIPPEYKATLESMKYTNPAMYLVYAKGIWGRREGVCFNQPIMLPVEEWPDYENFSDLFYGLDFGYNSPMALIEVGLIMDEDGKPELYEREVLYATKIGDDLLLKQLRENIRGIPNQISSAAVPIYADPANPDKIEYIKGAGFNCKPAHKAQGSIKAGIDYCNTMIQYTLDTNTKLNEEYMSYTWATDKNGHMLDEPIDENNHLMDARRYAIYTHLAKRKDMFAGGGMDVY